MTPEEITRLWQLSMNDAEGMRLGFTTQQHYFAALVAAEIGIETHRRGYESGLRDGAAAEREACAKVCDDLWQEDGTAYDCRDAIRARGQK